MQLHPNPPAQYHPASFSQDEIDRAVQDVLSQERNHPHQNEILRENDPIFQSSWNFARRWNICPTAVRNHIRLACGDLRLPVLLLLNPKYDELDWEEMIQRCTTLKWLQGVRCFQTIGLDIIPILDICTLLSDDSINRIHPAWREIARSEAFCLTQKMLARMRPKIIVSCQCSTGQYDRKWHVFGGQHFLCAKLCSSMAGARNRKVNRVYIEGYFVNVVQGFHPSSFLGHWKDQNGFDKNHDKDHLLGIFQSVYLPFTHRYTVSHPINTSWTPSTAVGNYAVVAPAPQVIRLTDIAAAGVADILTKLEIVVHDMIQVTNCNSPMTASELTTKLAKISKALAEISIWAAAMETELQINHLPQTYCHHQSIVRIGILGRRWLGNYTSMGLQKGLL